MLAKYSGKPGSSMQTKFRRKLLKRTRFTLCDDFTAFLLMTDGVFLIRNSRPKPALANLSAWDALWDDLQAGAGLSTADEHPDQKLLEWLDFWSQGNHDDRTIALIY